MTDPADTDAAAGLTGLEMDLLRKDVAFWIEQSDIWKRLANDERDVTDHLRAVIANAPHGTDCWLLEDPDEGVLPSHRRCTCWKADVL